MACDQTRDLMKRQEHRDLRRQRARLSGRDTVRLEDFATGDRRALVFGDTPDEAATNIDLFWKPLAEVTAEQAAEVMAVSRMPECANAQRVYADTLLGRAGSVEFLVGLGDAEHQDRSVDKGYEQVYTTFGQDVLQRIDEFGFVFWSMVFDRRFGGLVPVVLQPYCTTFVLWHNTIDGRQRMVPRRNVRDYDFAALSYVVHMPTVTMTPTGAALELQSRCALMLRDHRLLAGYYRAAEAGARRLEVGTLLLQRRETTEADPAAAAAAQGGAMRDALMRPARVLPNGLRIEPLGVVDMLLGGQMPEREGLVVRRESAAEHELVELQAGLSAAPIAPLPLGDLRTVADIARSSAASIWGLPISFFQEAEHSYGKHAEEMRIRVNEAMARAARMLETIMQMAVDASFGVIHEEQIRQTLADYFTIIWRYRSEAEEVAALTEGDRALPETPEEIYNSMFPSPDAVEDLVRANLPRVRVRYNTMLTLADIVDLMRIGSLPIGAAHQLIRRAHYLDPDVIDALDAADDTPEAPASVADRRRRAADALAGGPDTSAPPAKRAKPLGE